MAEQLRNHYGAEIPRRIATMISAVHPAFPAKRFLTTALAGYDELNLMARGRQIAAALALHLPEDFDAAADILLASLGPRPRSQEGEGGMASFLYLPHTLFVASHGLDHFETSMRAQYELTQRFTAEFSMRPFLERHEQATLARLAEWAGDANEHVRRLVSEATRPRLPWAARLRRFQRDPRPVLALLELLKDDPSLYVRRSVANNLNDIGKDKPDAEVMDVAITPARATIGGAVSIGFTLRNTRRKPQQLLVDFRIHYRKANGKSSPKVFKLRRVELAPGESLRLEKSVSLREMTTRRHYPGRHEVDLVVNGATFTLGSFSLRA